MATVDVNSFAGAIFRGSWIWPAHSTSDQYVCFRRKFVSADLARNAKLSIAVDTDFVAYLNGEEIGRGQFSDHAHSKTWSSHAVNMIPPGENILAILVFFKGEQFFDYEAGTAGLLACLEMGEEKLFSDETWRAKEHPSFESGQKTRVTNQMGFTFSFDARKNTDWLAIDFDDSTWKPVRIVQERGEGPVYRELAPRPLPNLRLVNRVAPKIAAQGSYVSLHRSAVTAENMAGAALAFEFPWQVFSNPELGAFFSTADDDSLTGTVEQYSGPPRNGGDFLSGGPVPLSLRDVQHGAEGRYLILDLHEEVVGLLELEIEASGGTILEIASGEHLNDGRVRSAVGGRNFADRYVCREGRQTFQMPFRRFAARYLEVHVSNYESVEIYCLSLRRVEYPTDRKGSFLTADRFSRRLHETSVRTLELCRHEHYEDCPWREQALYAYDSRLQALFGYYAFGDYQFPKISFELLGRSADTSGYVALTAPGKCEINIPVFSFAWVVAVSEHALFSGDIGLVTTFRCQIEKLLLNAVARHDASTGLYHPPEGNQFWHFYEWTPGLAGRIGQETLHGQHHITYNLYLREAVRAYLAVVKDPVSELGQVVSTLGESIHRRFWNEEAGYYYSELSPDGRRFGHHELVQALALCEEIVPAHLTGRVMKSLVSGQATRCSLSASVYLLKAALKGAPSDRKAVIDRLQDIWENILFSGATSMWETEHGAIDFDFAGSLCHGWASLPVWFHQAVVLGITPTSPGFTTFNVAILPSGHRQASGTVPTPHGEIRIEWMDTGQGLEVNLSGPEACRPLLKSYDDHPVASAYFNGSAIL